MNNENNKALKISEIDNLIADCSVSLLIHDKNKKKVFMIITTKNKTSQNGVQYSIDEQYYDNT